MNTPICDFVKKYEEKDTLRLHMPGHKGKDILGFESLDITEICGADSLYNADGIIKQSEENASFLFGADTFYSTEGSSHCIRAMLFLAKQNGIKKILAGRNAHKTFLTACAILNIEIIWLYGNSSYLSCSFEKQDLEKEIKKENPDAVYITTPDYLGQMADISAISSICNKFGKMLIVDNAHGAYLKFLSPSLHPIDLGANMCCDSAHKTLPCLTGGAYLHIRDKDILKNAKNALSVFGSTSPSYLILQSLDMLNSYLADGFREKLSAFILRVENLKKRLRSIGYTLYENEPLKITICTKAYGYTGFDFAELLREKNAECEFADPDFIVLMLSLNTDLERLFEILKDIEMLSPITSFPPKFEKAEKILSLQEALLSDSEEIETEEAEGRILANINVSCPPAVPIAVCGEKISKKTIECFKYYGIKTCFVVK